MSPQRANGRSSATSGLSSTPKPGVSGNRIRPFTGTGSPTSSGWNIGTTWSASGAIIKNSANGLLVRVMTKWYEYTLDPCGTTSAPYASASAKILLSSVIPYVLEQLVLRRVTAARFAILLAMLPVTAALIGAVLLAQIPNVLQLVGMALVCVAIVLSGQRPVRPENPLPG